MDKEFLSKAGVWGNSGSIESKGPQDSGEGWEGQAQVRDSQHGEEIVHGCMERGFCPDHKEDATVAEDGQQVHEADGNRDPYMSMLQSWDSNQKEGGDLSVRGIDNVHDKSVGKYFQSWKDTFNMNLLCSSHLLSALLSET